MYIYTISTFDNHYDDGPSNTAIVDDESFSNVPTTANSKYLENSGYEIATANVTHYLYAKNVDPQTPVAQADYFVTFAKENGTWLIVETTKIQ